jgi:RHS repeat-associated protein
MRYYTCDGNGNISEVLDATGEPQAHYEYDPFGNTTVATGAWADSNEWRFSTKPFDAASGLYYYGYRFYDPVFGRWPNRDLIGERGGINPYNFTNNNSVNQFDILGLLAKEYLIDTSTLILEGIDVPKDLINPELGEAGMLWPTSIAKGHFEKPQI